MRNQLKKWRVGDTVTRLILLKIQPGRELEVGRLIEERCRSAFASPEAFKVFRLFGSYDLLIIQDQASLATTDFVNIGSIPFVTGSTEYVCSKWVSTSTKKPARTFRLDALSDPLLAMCFLKINPELTRRLGLVPELSFASYAEGESSPFQMLSTFGWAEIVLLICQSTLDSILQAIGTHIPDLVLRSAVPELDAPKHSFAEKTLTIIGHALAISDVSVEEARRPTVSIGPELHNQLRITLSAACKPQSTGVLERSAVRHFGKTTAYARLGTRDIEFDVPLQGIETFNALLAKMDAFRRENSQLLIRTHTSFKYSKQRALTDEEVPPPGRRRLSLRLDPSEAKALSNAGPEGTSVATAIYQFNNLLQTDVSADVYVDLMRFMIVLKNEMLRNAFAREADARQSSTFRRLVAQKLSHLEFALAQRSQSVYAGLEESPFGVFPAGIGLQRVVKGLEAYATMVLSRYKRDWNGFVRFGHLSSRMEHFTDVLIVPMDASVRANRHWTLTHEIMHVLQTTEPSLSIRSLKRCDQFGNELSAGKLVPGTQGWFVLLESMVDVLDFALCCPLSLEDYLQTIWGFLEEEIFRQQAVSQWSIYLWRSFSVIAYHHYAKSKDMQQGLFRREEMAALLQRYIKKMSRWADLAPLRRPNRRGENDLDLILEKFMNDFVFYLPSMFRKISTLAGERQRGIAAAKRAVRRLKRGEILSTPEILDVDGVAWALGLAKDDDNRLNQAWLLSLWHHFQIASLGLDVSSLTRTSPPTD
jgi:hypothetical protein